MASFRGIRAGLPILLENPITEFSTVAVRALRAVTFENLELAKKGLTLPTCLTFSRGGWIVSSGDKLMGRRSKSLRRRQEAAE